MQRSREIIILFCTRARKSPYLITICFWGQVGDILISLTLYEGELVCSCDVPIRGDDKQDEDTEDKEQW